MALFGRSWRVQVGELDVSALDVSFAVKRSLHNARPGVCELKVYNLDARHRAELTAARRPVVILSAGYGDAPPLLFRGDARKVVITRDGADWIADLTAGDGEHAIRTARASVAFGPDASIADVIRSLASSMGVGAGNASSASSAAALGRVGDVFPAGTMVHGRAHDELVRLCASAGLTFSIQEGVLQVLPLGRGLSRVAVELGPDTGLVGSPERGKGRAVKAKALLIPDLVPGRLVSLASDAVSGTFRIESGEYTGDTRGDDWYVDMVLKEPRA